MEQDFNTPQQVLEMNLKAGEGKVKQPFLKCILAGMMAGMFIAFGAASSNAAIHNLADQGLAKMLAGVIFPAGLMMIVLLGGELFTGDCLMIAGICDRRFSVKEMIKTLVIVWLSNLAGAVLAAALISVSGLFDYSAGVLGAFTIKAAYAKCTLSPYPAFCSGILCNILVCLAVLMATAAKDVAGKILAIFFPICLFVLGGFEHCVANMFYIPAGIFASMNENYVEMSQSLYGITAAQISEHVNIGGFFYNQLFVTAGNIIGGMVFVALPIYFIHRKSGK